MSDISPIRDHGLVRVLEELLDQAKTGCVAAVAFAAIPANGSKEVYGHMVTFSDDPSDVTIGEMQMCVGGLETCKHILMAAMLAADTRGDDE